MKVNAISFNLNRKLGNNIKGNDAQNKNAATSNRDFVYSYYPAFLGRSGKASNAIKLHFLKVAKTIHCPYCGLELIHPDTFKALDLSQIEKVSAETALESLRKIKHKLSKQDLQKLSLIEKANEKTPGKTLDELLKTSGSKASPAFSEVGFRKLNTQEYTKKLIDTMQVFEENLQSAQKSVFQNLRALNNQYPQKNMEELMTILRPKSLPKLQNVQLAVLQEMAKESCSLSKNSAQNLTQLISSYKDIILDKGNVPFKRKELFKELNRLGDIARNDEAVATQVKNTVKLLSEYSGSPKNNQALMNYGISEYIKEFSDNSAQTFLRIMKKHSENISKGTLDGLTKDLDGFANQIHEEHTTYGVIRKVASKMPSAITDADAFIVKYSKRNRMKNGRMIIDNQRPATEVVESLLKESVMGVDHYVPTAAGGADRRSNIVGACPPCNNKKDSEPVYKLIRQDPEESVKNYQLYLNDIADTVNKHEKNEDYLLNISRTIKSEAGGLIDIEISKIDGLYKVNVINKFMKAPASA